MMEKTEKWAKINEFAEEELTAYKANTMLSEYKRVMYVTSDIPFSTDKALQMAVACAEIRRQTIVSTIQKIYENEQLTIIAGAIHFLVPHLVEEKD